MTRSVIASVVAVLAVAGAAQAQVNGQLKPIYGPSVAVQSVGTQFGNSNLGQVGAANGSELNAAFGYIAGGNLNILLTGNLESNFNNLNIFIDSGVAGGLNQLPNAADLPDIGFGKLRRLGGDGSGNGLRFDSGFNANFYLAIAGGGSDFFVDGATLNTSGNSGSFIGQSGYGQTGTLTGGTNFLNALIAIDNSNTAGVNSFGDPMGDPLTAVTGIELQIPLASLGYTGGDIRVLAFIASPSNDFLSNQFLGALPAGSPNVGDPRGKDLSTIAGEQFFVIPTPGSLALMAMGGLIAARRRRA